MTEKSLAELELRSDLYDAMDGNLRMTKRHKLLDAYRAEVQRARDEQFAAWLVQKAREFPTVRANQESTPDYLRRLADKVHRGAIR